MSDAPLAGDPHPRPDSAEDVAAEAGASDPVPEPAVAAAPEVVKAPDTGGYRVELPTFEGPLDLLLHLIEEHELDVRDIPIAFVAAKYVEYITLMQELNIDVASEYLVMAATLAYIKSKMLLPAAPDDEEDQTDEELDPRSELVRRLLEYQKYKHAAEQLGAGDVLGRDVFRRGISAPEAEGPAPIAGLSLFKLLDAFQTVLSRATATVDHQIDFERFSITDRINELSEILAKAKRLAFMDLFEGKDSRAELIVTFLALLEMTRLRLTRLFQAGPLEPIEIELAVSEDELAAHTSDDGAGDAGGAGDSEEASGSEDAGDLEDADDSEGAGDSEDVGSPEESGREQD